MQVNRPRTRVDSIGTVVAVTRGDIDRDVKLIRVIIVVLVVLTSWISDR